MNAGQVLCKNEICELTIEDMNNLGYGVAHLSGLVVFVAGGVTGDVLRAKIIKVARDYAVGRVEELLTPSDKRITPDCAAFPRCGGCSFRHITDEYECALKESFVRSCFKKERLEIPVLSVLSAPDRHAALRCKAQYPLYMNAEGKICAGFFAARSHAPVEMGNCPALPEEFSRLSERFCALASEEGLSCYDESTGKGLLRHLILRKSAAQGKLLAGVVVNAREFPAGERIAQTLMKEEKNLCGVLVNFNDKDTNVILGGTSRLLAGEDCLTDTLCEKELSYGLDSFFQTNPAAAQVLFEASRALLRPDEKERVCDLYCGVGAAGLCVTPDNPLWGAECNERAVSFARENAQKNEAQAVYVAMDAADYYEAAGEFEIVIVDPPRAGLSEKLVRLLCEKPPKKLLYISCNPATLARDLSRLLAGGYVSGPVQPVDLFPRTSHVECAVVLTSATAK